MERTVFFNLYGPAFPLIYKYSICSLKSTFQLRTYDPEGVILYGDTKNGKDWYILSLKDGTPLMQISREDALVSVTGGPKLNDGKWHIVSFQCS